MNESKDNPTKKEWVLKQGWLIRLLISSPSITKYKKYKKYKKYNHVYYSRMMCYSRKELYNQTRL